MSEKVVFFEDADRVAKGEALKLRVFMIFSLLLGVANLYYGVLREVDGHKISSIIVSGVGVLCLLNGFVYPLHKKLEPAKYMLSILMVIALVGSMPSGGSAGSTAFWMVAFPAATYLFFGFKGGNIMTAIYFPAIIIMHILEWRGVVPVFYTPAQYREMWSVIVLLTVFGFVAELQRNKEREESVRQRESMSVLLQNMPAGILMFEVGTGRLVAANAEATQLLGNEVAGDMTIATIAERLRLLKESGEIFPSEELPVAKALVAGEQSGRSDIFVKKDDGLTHVLRMSGAPIRDAKGKVISAIAVIEDATKEHEIDQMKSEFVSLASHQLKTPLTSISWGMETLLSDEEGRLSAEQKTTIEEVGIIVGRLSRLVSDLLNVSRIETGRKFNIVKKSTDVTELVASVIKESLPSADRRNIALVDSMPEGLMLEVDGDKCREVLTNLIGNAIKYSKDGGRVEVGVTKTQKDTILYVQDDGVGIPKHQQERIFEKFFRAENVAEEIEGTGLGLYIVRAIVEKHGGRIWFSTEVGKGTTFYAAFPNTPAPKS